jgi:hypothetical protein
MKTFTSLLFILILPPFFCCIFSVGSNNTSNTSNGNIDVSPTAGTSLCNGQFPKLNPPPRVDSPDSAHTGDLSYLGGHVVDGTANVYMIYWVDESVEPIGPKYISLTEQFVTDLGQSPLYANLSQYHDASGQCPVSARLAGTFVDKRPLPPDLEAKRLDPNVPGDQVHAAIDSAARKEIADVAAKEGWNTQDYHNVYGILPTISDTKPGACGGGAHNWLLINTQGGQQKQGSPFMYLPYPCGFLVSSSNQDTNAQDAPNQDIGADNMVDVISHELLETVSDPYVNGWAGNGGEVADKCVDNISFHIDPQTHGNVTWNGHHYAVQQEYDNAGHGCVLEGP